MTKTPSPKQLIGRAEPIQLPEITKRPVHARIDTGARTSAIWVSEAKELGGKLAVTFFGKGHEAYTGEKTYFNVFTQDLVTSSNGHKELRYKVKLLVVLEGRKIRASFTLANRSTQVYPVLIGRNVLRGKFVVDVKLGNVLARKEAEHIRKRRESLGRRGK